jgi:sigma-B regulation protein RsbU (phosphoserine phosphatase)
MWGGDFFQYFRLSHHRLAMAMADVTGHAMEAAIPVVMFSGMLKSETGHGNPLDNLFGRLNLNQLFNNLNQPLCETWNKRTFVCFLMGELDIFSRTFSFANSGCPFPYHYRAATGTVVEVEAQAAYPLGINSNTNYQAREIQLQPGDRLVFCSDGIIEASNAHEEFFGFERTAESIREGCRQDLAVADLLDCIFASVDQFAAGHLQDDDRTCMVLHAR